MANQVSANIPAATAANVAETVAAAIAPGPVNPAIPVLVSATLPLIGAASVTAITMRLRRGTTVAGALLATAVFTVTGAQTVSGALEIADAAYDGTGYNLTIQATGAAGTCGPGSLAATPQQQSF
jgi:hypothetical protein